MPTAKEKSCIKTSNLELQKIDNVNNSNPNNKSFLNTKNIILITLGIILSIVFISLTFIFVLDIKWDALFVQIKNAFTGGRFAGLWLISLLLFLVCRYFFTYIVFTTRLKKIGIKVSFSQKLLYTLTIWFLQGVTPANFVTDPYTVFWLKTQGLPTHKASALVLSTVSIWQLVQIIVTLPSFVFICMEYSSLIESKGGIYTFWIMVVGLLFDFISLGFLILCMINKHIHMYVSMFFNKIKKILHLKYSTKEEIREKYLVKATLFNDLKVLIKDWKITLYLIFWFLIYEIYIYLLMFFSLKFIGYDYEMHLWNIFNCANVSITANKMLPIPGGELTIEAFLKLTISSVGGIEPKPTCHNPDTESLINNGVLIWRTFSSYIPMIFGIFGFAILTVKQFLQIKNKNIFSKKI